MGAEEDKVNLGHENILVAGRKKHKRFALLTLHFLGSFPPGMTYWGEGENMALPVGPLLVM